MMNSHDGRGSEDETVVPLLEFDLDQEAQSVDSNKAQALQRRTPLPMTQLIILCAVRLAEPIAYTQIFPVCIATYPLNLDS